MENMELLSAPYSAFLSSNVSSNVKVCFLHKDKWETHPTQPYFNLNCEKKGGEKNMLHFDC